MRKRLVYICSPCRGDIEKNIEKAQRYCREAETLPIGDALIVLPSHVGHLNGVAAIESTTVRINGEMILDLAIELRRHPGHDITLEADKGADSEVDQ